MRVESLEKSYDKVRTISEEFELMGNRLRALAEELCKERESAVEEENEKSESYSRYLELQNKLDNRENVFGLFKKDFTEPFIFGQLCEVKFSSDEGMPAYKYRDMNYNYKEARHMYLLPDMFPDYITLGGDFFEN